MDEMYVDPVCGMEVTPETAAESAEYEGQIFYFCSSSCCEQFENNPEKYTRFTR
jgi:Cu+-exporting ATPase